MKTTRSERVTSLSIVLTGDQPPSEFRVFTAGKVDTSKGEFLFDEVAAASVMADYAKQGNELMVDYDHASLAGLSIDPAQAGKSAGWFNLEVRNGELWAVNVRWTPPAHAALSAKEWRYMSPAFQADESGRITSLINVALTNLPATRRLEPLMAANAKETLSMLSPEVVKKALEAIKNGDAEAAMAILEEMIANGGEAPADPPADPAPTATADAPAPKPEDQPAEVAAALSAICSLSGKSLVASIADIRTWHASHVELATEKKKLADREAVLEHAERIELGAKLVTLAGEAPAAVWASSDSKALKPYLLEMKIERFREMVADKIKAKGGKPVALAISAPTSASVAAPDGGSVVTLKKTGEQVALSARETKMLEGSSEEHIQAYATRKASMKKAG